ncbi:hypothetical protein Tco_0450748 [Tanacetum coccineum]
MEDRDMTMEEYVQYETEKALRNGKVYNWETATYDKIRYVDDINDLIFFEMKFLAIVFDYALTSELEFSSEPTVVNTAYPIPWIRRFDIAYPVTWIRRIDFLYSFRKDDEPKETRILEPNASENNDHNTTLKVEEMIEKESRDFEIVVEEGGSCDIGRNDETSNQGDRACEDEKEIGEEGEWMIKKGDPTLDGEKGLITFTDGFKEVIKTPYRDPEMDDLTSEGHDLKSSRVILSDDDFRRGCERLSDLESGFYKDNDKLNSSYSWKIERLDIEGPFAAEGRRISEGGVTSFSYLVLLICNVTPPDTHYSAATQFGGVREWYQSQGYREPDTVMSSDSASSEVTYTSISSHGDLLAWAVDFFRLQEPDSPEAAPASPDYVPGPEEPD